MATILIADDHQDTVRMIELLIKSYTEHTTITAANGAECIAAAPRANLILMDIRMPGIDGIQAFRTLRENPDTAEIPIIFMTAYPDQVAEIISGDKLGTIDYLLKPVSKEQLVNRLKVLLGIREARVRFKKTRLSPSEQFILLLAAMEQSADGITVTDRNGSWLMINHSQASMFGYTSDEFLALKPSRLYRPESARRIGSIINKELEQNDHWEGELQGVKKNGDVFPLLVSLSVVKDNAGSFIGIMGISKDISALRKAFTELQKAQEALIRSERMKALMEMIQGLAHEFNNLLASILGNTQLLIEDVDENTARRRLVSIERAATTAAGLLKKMQVLRTGETGSRKNTADIRNVLEGALAIAEPRWRSLAEENGIAITVEPRLRSTPLVNGTAEELKTAVLNVIFNAVESMPEGGRISVRNWNNDRFVYIRISDNGSGMSDEIREKAFEPFVTTRRPLRAGLGLSSTYGIIKRHGGTIRLRSREGRGTSVTIKLPIIKSLDTDKSSVIK